MKHFKPWFPIVFGISVCLLFGYGCIKTISNAPTPPDKYYESGFKAQQYGVPATANPYRTDSDRVKWLNGWMDANKTNIETGVK